jgi:hypothetical protein
MRIYIDFSVFTHAQAVGNVHGFLELEVLPRQGELVSFEQPRQGVMPVNVAGFPHQLAVERVIHGAHGGRTLLSLADVVVGSRGDAAQLFAYMHDGFGLYADEHDHAEKQWLACATA